MQTFLTFVVTLGYACAWLDALLPQPKEGSRWVPVRKIVHLAGANVGNARNLLEAGGAK